MTTARAFEEEWANTVSETFFQTRVLAIIASDPRGYVYHTHDSRRSHKGWPDLAVLGPMGALFRELKTAKGKVTPEQGNVIARLSIVGLDATVWRPADLLSGRIVRELAGIGLRVREF